MDWTAPIDIYCERVSAGFWAERVNAISNVAFLAVGAWGLSAAMRAEKPDWMASCLAGLVVVIAIGSFLFHTFADRWSAVADVLPISLFIYCYLTLVLFRFLRLGGLATLATLIGFFALSLLIERLLFPLIAGSAAYVPALSALWALGGLLRWKGHRAAGSLLGAGWLFLVSLGLRTLDEPLCGVWPVGTHFLWHILNAATLALLLDAALRYRNSRRTQVMDI